MSAPAGSPEYEFAWAPSPAASATMHVAEHPPARIVDNFSPPLIAMFAVLGAAFLIVFYARILSRQIRRVRRRWQRWRRCRRFLRSAASDYVSGSQSQTSPPPYHIAFPFSADSYSDHVLSPYGLDDAAIKTIPLSLFSRSKAKQPAATNRDCAVCLLEFEDGEWLRTLPICAHSFHVECIDVWLRSHATCPLCRAAVSFRSDSPFVPMREARIRPNLDDIVLEPPPLDPASPIMEEMGRGFLLKRSYSFGFEGSVAADRMMMEAAAAATASPAWQLRYQQSHNHQHRGFWSKRWPSPFGGGGSARGFSSQPYYYRRGGSVKSPFMKRWGFGPLSSGGGSASATASSGTAWGRRSRSMTSPSAAWTGRPVGVFSSSRMRCGDPEALLSPERLNRR